MCESDIISGIENFYTSLGLECPILSKVSNPLRNNIDEQCILLNNKKQEYYIHTYNPERLIRNIIDFNINERFKIDEEFRKYYLDNLNNMCQYEN
jgi:hypothetical protein